jgi:hypothetical protein
MRASEVIHTPSNDVEAACIMSIDGFKDIKFFLRLGYNNKEHKFDGWTKINWKAARRLAATIQEHTRPFLKIKSAEASSGQTDQDRVLLHSLESCNKLCM